MDLVRKKKKNKRKSFDCVAKIVLFTNSTTILLQYKGIAWGKTCSNKEDEA
jgi:hypothetical protein